MKQDLQAQTSWETKHLKSPVDGISIRYAVRPGSSDRVIVFLNGRSEYIEKYQDLPDDTDFSDATWVMMDHRGQGASEGLRSHVITYDHFAKDVAAVIQATAGNRPYALIAHSMGGLISAYGTITGILKPTHLVLCSPLFGILAPMPLAVARLLARLFFLTPLRHRSSGASVDRRAVFEGNILTSSRKRFDAMSNSQFKGTPPTFGWIHATFEAFGVIYNKTNIKPLKMPIGIIVGDKEMVVDRMAYEGWIHAREKVSGEKTTFRLIPHAHHELLNEADEFRKEAIDFINGMLRK